MNRTHTELRQHNTRSLWAKLVLKRKQNAMDTQTLIPWGQRTNTPLHYSVNLRHDGPYHKHPSIQSQESTGQTFRNRTERIRMGFLNGSEEKPTLTMNPALSPEFRCTISTSRTQSICIEEQICLIQRRIHSYSFKPHMNTSRDLDVRLQTALYNGQSV